LEGVTTSRGGDTSNPNLLLGEVTIVGGEFSSAKSKVLVEVFGDLWRPFGERRGDFGGWTVEELKVNCLELEGDLEVPLGLRTLGLHFDGFEGLFCGTSIFRDVGAVGSGGRPEGDGEGEGRGGLRLLKMGVTGSSGGGLVKREDLSFEGFGASRSCPAVMRRSALSLIGRVRLRRSEDGAVFGERTMEGGVLEPSTMVDLGLKSRSSLSVASLRWWTGSNAN